MPPRRPMAVSKPKNAAATLKRVFSYMSKYAPLLVLVVIFIICSSLAGIIGNSFLQRLIDNYITPLAENGEDPALRSGFIKTLLQMLSIYGA